MGGDWLDGVDYEQRQPSPSESTADDTAALVLDLISANVDAILYAGGDGTTRDTSMHSMVMKRHSLAFLQA